MTTTTYGHGNDDVTQAHEPRYYGAHSLSPPASRRIAARERLEKERKSALLNRIKKDERDGEGNQNSSLSGKKSFGGAE